jgi:hypothetical protein
MLPPVFPRGDTVTNRGTRAARAALFPFLFVKLDSLYVFLSELNFFLSLLPLRTITEKLRSQKLKK